MLARRFAWTAKRWLESGVAPTVRGFSRSAPTSKYSGDDVEDDIPLQRSKVTIPFNNLEGSTITARERDVFQRLFQNVIRSAAAKRPTVQAKGDVDQGNDGVEPQVKSREELLDSVSKFPGALRDIALSTAERIERDSWEASRKAMYDADTETFAMSAEALRHAAEAKEFQDAELARLTAAIDAAPTDLAVWDILEVELFQKIAALKLDQFILDDSSMIDADDPQKASGTQPTTSSRLFRDISNFGVLYPAILNQAIYVWRVRFPTSVLPVSILPRIKQLGRSSYALGATAALYHQLLQFTWTKTGDFEQVIALLQEMDAEGIDFSHETHTIIRDIVKDWEWRIESPPSKMEKLMMGTVTMQERFAAFRKWRGFIEDRLDAQALREANQKIAQHLL